ncbi:GAF domain-containing protein [Streptomyces stramineus]
MDARENVMAWGRVVDTASAAGSPVSLPVGCTACAGDVRADGLGVCLITSGRIRSVAYAADERSHRLENAQLVAGEGPCTEAYLFRRTVEMDLREPPERWPVFVRTAAELGIRSVTAVPLLVGDVPVGVMDLYRTTPNPLSDDSRARLDAYARVLALLALDAHPALIGWEQAAPEPGPQGTRPWSTRRPVPPPYAAASVSMKHWPGCGPTPSATTCCCWTWPTTSSTVSYASKKTATPPDPRCLDRAFPSPARPI